MSCAPVYVPNVINAPMLSEKGEMDAGINLGTSGFDAQFSFAVADNLAIMANGSVAHNDSTETSDSFHQHVFGEAGFGYFMPFKEKGRLETFVGYGLGKSKSSDEYSFINNTTVRAAGYYHRVFVQSNVGFAGDIFESGFCLRAAYLHFNRFEYAGMEYLEPSNNLFVEPAIFLRLGWKYMKLQTQLGFSYPVTSAYDFSIQPVMFSIGANFSIKPTDL